MHAGNFSGKMARGINIRGLESQYNSCRQILLKTPEWKKETEMNSWTTYLNELLKENLYTYKHEIQIIKKRGHDLERD